MCLHKEQNNLLCLSVRCYHKSCQISKLMGIRSSYAYHKTVKNVLSLLQYESHDLKELCHNISVFIVTEARWGSSLSNQVHRRRGFVMSTCPCLAGRSNPAPTIGHVFWC